MKLKTINFFLGSCFLVLISTPFASAATSTPLSVRDRLNIEPNVIDEQAKIRDILEYKIKITNRGDRQEEFYAIVADILPEQGVVIDNGQDLGRETLSSWLEIQRSHIVLHPKESIEVPLKIDVSLYAQPGKRHGVIDFVSAPDYYKAMELAKLYDNPRLLINIDVVEDVIERAKMDQFFAVKSIFLDGKATFNLKLENSGNRELAPQGELFIYNRRNQEVARLPFGGAETMVAAGTEKSFEVHWPSEKVFGKFKAKVELEYGSSTKKDLQDVAYFWMLPKKYLIVFAVLLVVFLSLIRFKGRRRRRASRAIVVEGQKSKNHNTILNLKDK